MPRIAPAAAIAAAAFGLAFLPGCSGESLLRPSGLEPQAFRASPQQPATAVPGAGNRPRPIIVPRAEGTQGPVDVTLRAGDPETSGSAQPSGGALLIDSKIGDINGHPIWASDFFDDNLSARLRANAQKMSRREWLDTTRTIINERLQARIDDYLIKDEGLATLTPEMKQFGLAAILAQWRENQKSRNMGSELLADQAAQQNQTQYYDSLDAQAREFQDKLLIYLMTDKLERSIDITASAVRRFYAANPELFDPPPVAIFSMIVVSSNRPDDADTVRWALETGVLFADIASQPLNNYKADQAGRAPDKEFRGEYGQEDLFARAPMAAAARKLKPGEWTGPFDDGTGSFTFLRLDRIVRNTISLYDAQLAIESSLRNTEFQARMRQRIDRLKSRSSLTDQGEMARRLMEFAEAKFLPSGG